MKRPIMLLAIAVIGLAACREKPAVDQQTNAGMQSMKMKADSLMPMMRAHLDSLAERLSPEMIAAHDAMASQMLDAMGSDMRMMGMQADSAWAALTDSVRQDLAALPSLSGRALEARLTAHQARMRRRMDMHSAMMR